MGRYLAICSYDGTSYYGFQKPSCQFQPFPRQHRYRFHIRFGLRQVL